MHSDPCREAPAAIALDLGTTSIKAGVLNRDGALRLVRTQPAPPVMTAGGRYESDALAYAEAAERALTECIAHCEPDRPVLGLSCQRSSFLIWERASGRPVTHLISWQDSRGEPSCEALRSHQGLIRELTGLRLTPYYLAPKLRIILRQNPAWRDRLLAGEWLVGTLDTFLIWRWTAGAYYVTDASMAARTVLMDIQEARWSSSLCALFDIPISILPQIRRSAELHIPLAHGITLEASVGDQSAALIATVGEGSHEALVNLGTGGFVARGLPDTGNHVGGYLKTLVYRDNRAHFAIEGTLNSIAAALAAHPVGDCSLEDLGETDIFSLAEPSGLGAPYFRNDIGLRFSDPIEELAPRQVAALLLEAIVFRVARILEEFHRDRRIERVYLSGGLSELPCLQQGIAQCAPCGVYRLHQKEGSLHGAALLASGMMALHRAAADRVGVAAGARLLVQKFERWKAWLDQLLVG